MNLGIDCIRTLESMTTRRRTRSAEAVYVAPATAWADRPVRPAPLVQRRPRMLIAIVILGCCGFALAASVGDVVTMIVAGVAVVVAAALKIVPMFGDYFGRRNQTSSADPWLCGLHDTERLVQLVRGELEGDLLIRTMQHLDDCDACAAKFQVIMLLRSTVVDNPARHHTDDYPPSVM